MPRVVTRPTSGSLFLLAVACLATSVLVAACGGRHEETPPPAPVRADVVLPVESRTIHAVVPRHSTLETLLREHAIPSPIVQAAIESARPVFNPKQLRAEQPYRLVLWLDGLLREFEYQIDTDRFLRIANRDRATPEKLDAEVLLYHKDTRTVTIEGRIDREHSSLIAAMTAAGERVPLAISLAELFGGQVDFENDLQPGDSFEVLFETSSIDGQFAGYGPILAARFTNEGKPHEAFRWTNPDTKKAAYYDQDGRSLKRFVLASPLRFTPRVTSGFSRRRVHPLHRTVRAHLGVDYAAPVGTPVVAVANGVIVSAGWAGAGGRQVRIRHASGFESYYLHLSAFARGIKPGAQVDQGQLIGRVGASGIVTGPHLDYRLRKNGVFVDPRREHARQPPGEPIPASYLADFGTARDALVHQFPSTLRTATTAAPPSPAAVAPATPDAPKEKPQSER